MFILKVYIISDTHLGIKNNNLIWHKTIEDYFYKSFIPSVKKTVEPGDILIHCGDVFDNRSTIGLRTLSFTSNLFKDLLTIFSEVHIIGGNHDMMYKNSNDISSIDILQDIPNMYVYKEPKIIKRGDKEFFMMPWNNDNDEFINIVSSVKRHVDYMFCHAEIQGAIMRKFVRSETGVDRKTIESHFDMIFSGHLHTRHKTGKCIYYVGSPYQMNFNDCENARGYTILHEDGHLEFVKNEISPKFMACNILDLMNTSVEDLNKAAENNFLKFFIPIEEVKKINMNIIYDKLKSAADIKVEITGDDKDDSGLQDGKKSDADLYDVSKSLSENMQAYIDLYCQKSEIPDGMRDSLKKVAIALIEKYDSKSVSL
ncbi:MAG: hypothetical protein EOM87_04360 [Clostridia bacterium]|nr:hypothetical protein [Clostridia bacterium]